MLAFVDESGDAGRKIAKGSSPYFVVALVTFQDDNEALTCDERIGLLRGELGLPTAYEFHFAKNSKKVRQAFLSAVNPFPFFYHVFALNKNPERLYGPGFENKDSLYKYAVRLTFENAKPFLDNAIVVIDENGDAKFRDELATYLRKRVKDPDGRRLIRKVKLQRSSGNNLLQLADYVVGVASRFITTRTDGIELRRRFLAAHEMSLQVWPK